MIRILRSTEEKKCLKKLGLSLKKKKKTDIFFKEECWVSESYFNWELSKVLSEKYRQMKILFIFQRW